jgi:hypothetical protein
MITNSLNYIFYLVIKQKGFLNKSLMELFKLNDLNLQLILNFLNKMFKIFLEF